MAETRLVVTYETVNDSLQLTHTYGGGFDSFAKAELADGTPVTDWIYFFGTSGANSVTVYYTLSDATRIPASAFSGTEVVNVAIPDSVTHIGAYSFEGTKLSSLTLSDNVTNVNNEAFRYCNISDVVLGSGLTNLGLGLSAFFGNPITSLTCYATTAPYISGRTVVGGVAQQQANPKYYFYPEGSEASYNNKWAPVLTGWSGYTIGTVPPSPDPGEPVEVLFDVSRLGRSGRTVHVCSALSQVLSIKLEDDTDITQTVRDNNGEYTFWETGMHKIYITFTSGSTHIPQDAFMYTGINPDYSVSVNVPDSYTSLGYQSFAYNDFDCVTLGSGIVHTAQEVFYFARVKTLISKAPVEPPCSNPYYTAMRNAGVEAFYHPEGSNYDRWRSDIGSGVPSYQVAQSVMDSLECTCTGCRPDSGLTPDSGTTPDPPGPDPSGQTTPRIYFNGIVRFVVESGDTSRDATYVTEYCSLDHITWTKSVYDNVYFPISADIVGNVVRFSWPVNHYSDPRYAIINVTFHDTSGNT